MTVRDSSGNPFIDFVWGNIPMQPNYDREIPLDPELDNHIIVVSKYEGFPQFIQEFPYNDTIINKTVPDVVGMFSATAKTTLGINGLNWTETLTTSGATSENNGKIQSQSPSGGSLVNDGDTVSLVKYNYIAPATNPIAGMSTTFIPAGWSINSGEIIMYLNGTTTKPSVGNTITVAGTSATDHNQRYLVLQVGNDNAYNTGGTAVKLTPQQNGISSTSSSGGTWALV